MTDTFIYFIFDPQQDAVKIGKTAQPLVRLTELRAQYGTQITPLLWLVKPSTFERQLHRHFAPYHLRAEWFRYSEPIRQFINEQLEAQSKDVLPKLLLLENRHRMEAELGRMRELLDRMLRSGALRSRDHPGFEGILEILNQSVRQFEEEFVDAQAQLRSQQAEILDLKAQLESMNKSQQLEV